MALPPNGDYDLQSARLDPLHVHTGYLDNDVDFTRTITFHVTPEGPYRVYRRADVASTVQAEDGNPLAPLEVHDNQVVIPQAVYQTYLWVRREGFHDARIVFAEHELETREGPVEVHLDATSLLVFGWVRALVGLLVLGVVVAGVAYWRAVKQRLARAGQLQVAQLALEGEGSLLLGEALTGTGLQAESGHTWELGDLLGEGAVGVVYRACRQDDPTLDAALKLLTNTSRDPDFERRFRREVVLCSRIAHRGVVKVLDWGTHVLPATGRRLPFIVMELVSGQTLGHLMRARAPMAWEEAMPLWLELVEAIAAAHDAGVIHRDIKPDNVMLTGRGHVKLMDFGLARGPDFSTLTATGAVLGTPRYMAPEQLMNGKLVDARADLYAVGVVMYEMLSGRSPYDSSEIMALFNDILHGRRQPLSGQSAAHIAIIDRLMALDPGDRYASARELRADLQP